MFWFVFLGKKNFVKVSAQRNQTKTIIKWIRKLDLSVISSWWFSKRCSVSDCNLGSYAMYDFNLNKAERKSLLIDFSYVPPAPVLAFSQPLASSYDLPFQYRIIYGSIYASYIRFLLHLFFAKPSNRDTP